MTAKKYVSLNRLLDFLNNLKTLFATKTELNGKADSAHTHNDIYYTKTEIDNMEFITAGDIDKICNGAEAKESTAVLGDGVLGSLILGRSA